MKDIARLLREIVGESGQSSFVAKVLKVEGRYCNVERIGGGSYTKVRLNAVNSENGIYIKPAVGSIVLVSHLNEIDCYVSMFSTVDEIIFDGGKNGGLIKIVELENKLNALVDTFNNHVHSGVITAVSGGSGAPAVGTPGSSGKSTTSASSFDKSDFENEKIKH